MNVLSPLKRGTRRFQIVTIEFSADQIKIFTTLDGLSQRRFRILRLLGVFPVPTKVLTVVKDTVSDSWKAYTAIFPLHRRAKKLSITTRMSNRSC